MPSRPITIIGGGLAGLSLGAALARAGATVVIHEAGRLPRHRVCGEFITGLCGDVIETLGLRDALSGAAVCRTTGWHAGGRLHFEVDLPESALGISRRTLESRLLDAFRGAGGELRENSRMTDLTDGQGRVWVAGRRPDPASPWLGLKIHCRNVRLGHDLELHLGGGGYAGAARIEDNRVNVCGLFCVREELRAPRGRLLVAYLRACGLGELAARVEDGGPDGASAVAVSGLDFTRTWREESHLSLGDHHAPIPPYTGHGMAMALGGAAIALGPLMDYARGVLDWNNTAAAVRRRLAARHDARTAWARRLHPWLLRPAGQTVLLALARLNLLPFRMLYGATHGAAARTAASPA